MGLVFNRRRVFWNPLQIFIVEHRRQPKEISFLCDWGRICRPRALAIHAYENACGIEGSNTKMWVEKYPKVSKAKAAVWSLLTFLWEVVREQSWTPCKLHKRDLRSCLVAALRSPHICWFMQWFSLTPGKAALCLDIYAFPPICETLSMTVEREKEWRKKGSHKNIKLPIHKLRCIFLCLCLNILYTVCHIFYHELYFKLIFNVCLPYRVTF